MNFIIFDIEATCWQNPAPSFIQEIIEIGACKVNGYGEVEETFSRLVRPVVHPTLSHFCISLTGIRQEDVNRAKTFPEVVEAFQDWIDVDYGDFYLCSWGSFDKKLMVHDCARHQIDTEWLDRHVNLKRQYQDMKRLRHPAGLKATVDREGYHWTGQQHRGLDDAKNLVKIFSKYRDEWQY